MESQCSINLHFSYNDRNWVFFICLIAICIIFSANYPFVSFVYFYIVILVFFLIISRSSLHIRDISVLSEESHFLLKIFGRRHSSVNTDGMIWHDSLSAQLRSLHGTGAALFQQGTLALKGSQLCFLQRVVLS